MITFRLSYNTCRPYIAGLHLFEGNNLDDTRILELQNAVQMLQVQGALVKLAYGGEEWGNIELLTPVSIKNLICTLYTYYTHPIEYFNNSAFI